MLILEQDGERFIVVNRTDGPALAGGFFIFSSDLTHYAQLKGNKQTMDWLYALGGILAIIGFAFAFGWAVKNVKSPIAWGAMVIGCILYMLWLKGRLGDAFILLAVGLEALNHMPRWIGLTVAALIVACYIRFIIGVFAHSIDDIAREQQQINSRIEMLEESLNRKLDVISSRLPEREPPDYIIENRRQVLRD